MEFRIKKTEFMRGLRLAQSIADRKSTMPMLANALLRISGESSLLVAATDLNVSVSAELTSKNSGEGGITVGAKSLHDIVSGMPGEDIVVKRGNNNWAEILAGKVDYRVVGTSDRDFPKIPDHRECEFAEVEAKVLRDMIDKTLFSVSNDETRFHLNGVLLESNGDSARMVSTDGHRLSKVDAPLAGAPKLSAGVIIPKKGLVEIKRSLDATKGTCRVAIKTPHLFLSADGITLAVKLIDAEFPPYDQVIPTGNNHIVEVERGLLLDALRRAQLMSSETRGIKMSVSENQVRLTGDNPDIGEVQEDLEASYAGPELSIGFNPKYVVEMLSQMSEDAVTIALNDELDPVLIKPAGDSGYLGVVMPMRV